MRYVALLAFLFLSLSVSAQDIAYKLANASHRTWIGANVYDGSQHENVNNLTFYTSHKVQVFDRKYNTQKSTQQWWIATGEYVYDKNIVIKIGSRMYAAEFTKTNNGRDFLTLTRIPETDEEDQVIKTYYAED